ncbi:MAG: hypothetical protein RUMPE_00834 [Eubacteriales bacterium SKADARSKE-1]|nr:hypothetical protein [Eubacteriales bacterium SKADARSKE-1]
MDCLVELYNDDQISNLTVIFSFMPKKVVLLYDMNNMDKTGMDYLRLACSAKIPNIKFEYRSFDNSDIDEATEICTSIIHKNPHCFFDITGAGELGVIGAYLACKKTFTPIFKLNIPSGKLVNIYGCNSLEKKFNLPNLTMDTIFASHGTTITGYNHPAPPPELFNSILEFCNFIFENPANWKDLCYYLQTGNAKFPQILKKNFFWAPKLINTSKAKIKFSSADLLKKAERASLIYNLDISQSSVSFYFKNEKVKRYLTDFGVWLELYCYIELKQCNLFHDVRISVKIDWNNNGKDHFVEIINEIDITFFYKTRPCFLSCKLSEPSSEALQELSMYQSYFGGKSSKSILVVLNTVNKKNSYVYKRAKDMNIYMMDGTDIKTGKFIASIKKALKINVS